LAILEVVPETKHEIAKISEWEWVLGLVEWKPRGRSLVIVGSSQAFNLSEWIPSYRSFLR